MSYDYSAQPVYPSVPSYPLNMPSTPTKSQSSPRAFNPITPRKVTSSGFWETTIAPALETAGSIVSKVQHIAIKILMVIAAVVVLQFQPMLFSFSFVAGALLFPNQIAQVCARVQNIWMNNHALFWAVSLGMLIYVLPANLIITTSLYGAYLGYKLTQSSTPLDPNNQVQVHPLNL